MCVVVWTIHDRLLRIPVDASTGFGIAATHAPGSLSISLSVGGASAQGASELPCRFFFHGKLPLRVTGS
jgi:hypothetical protein